MGRTATDTGLVIRLLGDPDVRRGAQPIKAFESTRLQSLLAYLILGRDRPIPRQRLAFLFWPDSGDAQARTNLRQALHNLRRALGDAEPYLSLDGSSVRWRADAPASVDVVRFEEAATTGLHAGDEQALARAAADYRGDLLVGCYDDWLVPERDRLHALAVRALHGLASVALQRGDSPTAAATADRLLRLDPLDEAAHRLAIDAHAAAGDRVRALRRYHECVAVLDRELGVAPDAATVARYDALVTGGRPVALPQEPPTAGTGPGPLVGRDAELGVLVAAWRDASDRQPRFVLVTGEPGIGKSRLVEELATVCRRAGGTAVSARAYEAEGDRPYGPVIDVLQADAMRSAVDTLDPRSRQELERVLPHLATEARGPDTRDGARRRLFEAIARILVVPRRRLLLVIDDLHWCDPDTVDLLEFLLRAAGISGRALLVVGTVREEERECRPELRRAIGRLHAAAGGASELVLDRLDESASHELLRSVLDLSAHVVTDRVIAASDGNPLFLVEMARSGLVGDATGSTLELPARVQAVIDMRLDRLSRAARDLVAVASVVGRSFTIDLISRLAPDQQTAVTAVDELWQHGIVRARDADRYDFSHDRIRDVAYHRIGPARRRAHHVAIARALHELGTSEPAQVAYHLEHAGATDAAIDAYGQAVDLAARAFAHGDVIGLCRRALDLIASRPPGARRDEAELAFLVPLGVALMAGPGIADADVEVYERARALRRRRGLAAEPSTLRLSANAAIGRREFHTARRFGATLLQRGLDEDDVVLITEGHYLLGVTSFWLGDLRASLRSLEQALASHRVANTSVHLERYGQDPRAVCLVRGALTRFYLGEEAAAARDLELALEASNELVHEYTEVYVRMFGAWYLADSGQAEAAAALVRGMPATSSNPIVPIARAQFDGWAATERGDPATGVRLLREAQQIAHHHGPQLFEPYALLLLARSRLAARDPVAALGDASAALAVTTAEMPFLVPEAQRLTAELQLVTGGDPREACDALAEAAAVASEYGAVILERRARASLEAVSGRH